MGDIVAFAAVGFFLWFVVLPVIGSFFNGFDHFCQFWGGVVANLIGRLVIGGVLFGIVSLLQAIF
jgi:hypothetical protein